MGADELIPRKDPALMKAHLMGQGSGGGPGHAAECRICREGEGIHPGDLACGIIKAGCVHVVLHCIRGKDDIPDMDPGVQASGNAGIYDAAYLIVVDEGLGAEGGIYLPHSGPDDDAAVSFIATLRKGKASIFSGNGIGEGGTDPRHLFLHGTDKS